MSSKYGCSYFECKSINILRFMVDDIEDEWLNGDDFDFVHLRNMIPILKSPVTLLKQVYA